MWLGIILWILCSLNLLIYQCNLIAAKDKYKVFLYDNQKDCHSEHEQTLVPLQQELKEDVNFVSSAKWVRNGLLEGQLRDRLFGGMFCLPWRKSVSLLGEACSLKDNRSHGQREEHLSTHGNRQLVPVTAIRTQWERPMWLPSGAGQELKWKINGRDVWMLFRRDVTAILRTRSS